MVTAVTSFGRSGLYDWLIQRITALVLAAYTLFIVGFIFLSKDFGYESWSALFEQRWMRVFSLLALLSTLAHAWIGLWSVITDYLTDRMMGPKATFLRILTQIALGAIAVFYLVWGLEILWGV